MTSTDSSRDGLDDELADLVEGVLAGDQLSFSRFITHIEKDAPGYEATIKELHCHTTGTHTIRVTG